MGVITRSIRQRRPLLWSLGALLIGIQGCGPRAAVPPPAFSMAASELSSTEGAEIYNRYCQTCHGESGKDQLTWTSSSPSVARSTEELRAIIRDGRRGDSGLMPAWNGILDEREIAMVTHWIEEHR